MRWNACRWQQRNKMSSTILPHLLGWAVWHDYQWTECWLWKMALNVFPQAGGRDFPEQWILALAANWNHWGRFKKYWCLGLSPRDSDLIGPWCSLGIGIFLSSPIDSNMQSRLRITGVEAEIYMHKVAQTGRSPIKAIQ